jgi:hypothetical protein
MRQGMAQQNAKMKRVAMLNPAVKAADMRIGGDPTYAIIFEEMKRLGYVRESTCFSNGESLSVCLEVLWLHGRSQPVRTRKCPRP